MFDAGPASRRARPSRLRRLLRHRVLVGAAAVVVLAAGGTTGALLTGSGHHTRTVTGTPLATSSSLPPISTPPAPPTATASTATASTAAPRTAPPPTTLPSTTAAPTTTAAPATTTTTTTVPEPPPTSTPDAPGIAIATQGNPLPNYDLPGPYILRVGGTYYLYLSTPLGALNDNIVVVSGSPGHWDWAGAHDAMPTLPPWAKPNDGTYNGGQTWEPEVYRVGSSYVMYSSPTVAHSNPVQHCIAVARSSSPMGPFIPAAEPIVCQRDQGGDIDGQLVVDPFGPNGAANPDYFVWKSDNNSTPGAGVPTIWISGLSNDGMSLTGGAVRIFTADEGWQKSLVEAPQLHFAPDGSIWLFYSGGQGFFTPDYAMGVARCASLTGPCRDLSASPLIGTNLQGAGPGEETLFVGPDSSVWLLYSPWWSGQVPDVLRPVEAARIGFSANGPYVAQAGTFPAP